MAGITGAIQKGYTFSGTSPNNSVTAPKLNTLVDGATITTGLISLATEKSSLSATDEFLVLDQVAGDFRKVQVVNAIPTATGMRGSRGLLMFANTAEQVSIQASEILMRNAAGSPYVASSFSNVVNITNYVGGSPTPNGRDFASEASNTWYYLYAISTGSVDRGLISTSATSPSLPNGFPYYALLGAVRNDGSGDFVRFRQSGNDVAIPIGSAAGTASANLNPYTGGVEFTGVTAAANNTFQAVDLTRCVPPGIVARVKGMIGHTNVNQRVRVGVAGYSNGALNALSFTAGLQLFHFSSAQAVTGAASINGVVVAGFASVGNFDIPVYDSQQMWWAVDDITNVSTHNLRVSGYSLNL